ncbi:TonB-linked SusC/RagA family outer membrane protein [Dysgonomonas alginatilytica]|uniref:TonB-linked SusC/RagA family outer membrane protein n=1 Tax=Dysgonomonas alginatilytica TaxID=1605892 RepID=A0A2V3PPV9_9BACT|nr:TonB-dependent receptor [Dysgonomonas alginatilytica]PXV63601.1 TonB-linked SusC/RagA family outer membrane protein [Dysgonomonas alginatilytica]
MQKTSIKILVLVCTLFCFLYGQNLYAQQKMVSGTVTDTKGEALIGVSVAVKGVSTGTITDLDGKYTLSVATGAKTLVASYIGMISKEVPIAGAVVDIVMEDNHSELDEVVVIGYGTVKKRDLTGSVASISEKSLKDLPIASAAEALTGRLAGVSVVATEGSPDADIRIRVRGGTSISQDNAPLYVVDGIIVNSITDIPPSDIASIDVLKDAASTAIYGALGSNGVILITTKSGREGKISVTFNASYGAKKTRDFIEVLSPYEYVYYQHELDQTSSFQKLYGRFQDLDIYKSDPGIDWQDKVFGNTGTQQYYNVGVSGGSKAALYSLSLTRNDEDYIMINSGYKRDNVNFKVSSQIKDNLSMNFNVRVTNEVITGPSVSAGSGSNTKLRNAVKYSPTRGLYGLDSSNSDDDDQAGINSTLNNPVDDITNEYKKVNKFNNTYIAGVNWDIIKKLRFSSTFSYAFLKNNTDNVWTSGTGVSKTYAGQPVARITDDKGHDWRLINTLSYNFNLNKIHQFDVLAGQELSERVMNRKLVEARYFPVDFSAREVLAAMGNGQAEPIITSLGEPLRMSSFFGRVNYNLKDKYLMTFTARQDGTSVFGPGLYWGFFPGGALAWRASEEEFLRTQNSWLDNLKVRLSYGTVGNARVDPPWRQEYTSSSSSVFYPNEKATSILTPSATLKSNRLTWETTYSSNFGIDFGILKNRISGSIDLYNNITRNLIVRSPIPTTSGYDGQYQNIGQTSNRGLEFSMNAYIIDNKDFTLSGTFNIAFNKNKVDKFSNGNTKSKLYGSGWNGSAEPVYDYLVEEGSPLGQMYGYVTDGMYSFDDFTWDQSKNVWVINEGVADNSALISNGSYFGPGALKFKKIADDGTDKITENDRKVIGNALPKHTGGFGFNSTYKGFDASVFFNWSYGNDIYNANKLDNTSYLLTRKNQNLSSIMAFKNRFTTIDPSTGNNIYSGKNANPALLQELNSGKTIWHPMMTTTTLHSWAIEDGSFLRLNNLTVGYTLPKKMTKKWLIESLRIYATGYNLYCWTNYSGPDPEVSTRSSKENPFTPGVDYSAYPKAKTIVGGINITF